MKTFLELNKVAFLFIGCLMLWATVCNAQNEMYNVYVGEYPRGEVQWGQDAQGVAHDNNNWFITQTRTLWKIPLGQDLKMVKRTTPSVKILDLDKIPVLWNKGYDHFGDLSYYKYNGHGYLFVPIEDDNRGKPNGSPSAIAVFSAENLAYIDHAVVGLADAGWCEVDPKGYLYISNTGNKCFIKTIDWIALNKNYKLKFTKTEEFTFLDENGIPLSINVPQGGAISPGGKLLYMSAGYYKGEDNSWGINVFNVETHKRVSKSQNGTGPFNFEFHTGNTFPQEPEGMTIWETNPNHLQPGIMGQLHVIMAEQQVNDNIYFKHYTTEKYPVLYENDKFAGQPLQIINDIPSLSSRGFNDKASSIFVPSGWTIILYEDDKYNGASRKIISSDGVMKDNGWNDRVSSIRLFRIIKE